MRHDDQVRQDQLEGWYEADGRHEPSHPMHSLYTGLRQKYDPTINTTENHGSSATGLDDCSSSRAGNDQPLPDGTAEPCEL